MTFFEIHNDERVTKFISIIKTFKTFNDYITFRFEEDKLYVQGMDNSHICLYELQISKEWFHDYQQNDGSLIISCVSNTINKIMGLCKTSQKIMIGCHDENGDKIEIKISDYNNENEKYFEIPCINIDSDNLQPHDITYDVNIIMNSKELHTLISELSCFGDEIFIVANDNKIKFKAESTDGSMSQTKNVDEFVSYELNSSDCVYCKFQTNYLQHMLSVHKAFDNVSFNFQNDVPLCMFFSEKSIEDDNIILSLKFYLAPKLQDDDFELDGDL